MSIWNFSMIILSPKSTFDDYPQTCYFMIRFDLGYNVKRTCYIMEGFVWHKTRVIDGIIYRNKFEIIPDQIYKIWLVLNLILYVALKPF